jgi:hypothetical protein
MYSNAPAILTQIKNDITAPITALLPTVQVHLDEDLDISYADLPIVAIYPTEERTDADYNNDNLGPFKKELAIRIEIRMGGTPASTLCTPIINAIVATLQTDPGLGGLCNNFDFEPITWATGHLGSGMASGAALEMLIRYITPLS